MNKNEFFKRLEYMIINENYPKEANLMLLNIAANQRIRYNEIFDKMYRLTSDIIFSERVTNLFKLFYKGNPVFEKYMLIAIKEAKEA